MFLITINEAHPETLFSIPNTCFQSCCKLKKLPKVSPATQELWICGRLSLLRERYLVLLVAGSFPPPFFNSELNNYVALSFGISGTRSAQFTFSSVRWSFTSWPKSPYLEEAIGVYKPTHIFHGFVDQISSSCREAPIHTSLLLLIVATITGARFTVNSTRTAFWTSDAHTDCLRSVRSELINIV